MVRLPPSSLSPSLDLSVGHVSMCLSQIEKYTPSKSTHCDPDEPNIGTGASLAVDLDRAMKIE
jgi:hypothetical protein